MFTDYLNYFLEKFWFSSPFLWLMHDFFNKNFVCGGVLLAVYPNSEVSFSF